MYLLLSMNKNDKFNLIIHNLAEFNIIKTVLQGLRDISTV